MFENTIYELVLLNLFGCHSFEEKLENQLVIDQLQRKRKQSPVEIFDCHVFVSLRFNFNFRKGNVSLSFNIFFLQIYSGSQ